MPITPVWALKTAQNRTSFSRRLEFSSRTQRHSRPEHPIAMPPNHSHTAIAFLCLASPYRGHRAMFCQPCPFGERKRPVGRVAHQRDMDANSHRRAEPSRFAKRPRSGLTFTANTAMAARRLRVGGRPCATRHFLQRSKPSRSARLPSSQGECVAFVRVRLRRTSSPARGEERGATECSILQKQFLDITEFPLHLG